MQTADEILREKIKACSIKNKISEAMAWHVVMTEEIKAGRIKPFGAEAYNPGQPRDENGRWTDFGGGTTEISSKAFEAATVPLRKRASFGDQVSFMRGDDIDVGVISGPDNGEGIEITYGDGKKIRRKTDKLRMPKSGIRVRDS